MEILHITASFVIGFFIGGIVETRVTIKFLKELHKAMQKANAALESALERVESFEQCAVAELSKYKTPKEMQAFLDKIPK